MCRGGVILRLIEGFYKYAGEDIQAHLCCNEQIAGFAACGYAQASGNLGVAYATRGPGISNMFTSIVEAYQEALPVVFITAHGNRNFENIRYLYNQELEIVKCVKNITKYASNIENIGEVKYKINKAFEIAKKGRPGPVLIDINTMIWDLEIEDDRDGAVIQLKQCGADKDVDSKTVENIVNELKKSNRPILLIGDGVRNISREKLCAFADMMKIPVLSSRAAQDILCGSEHYYGYIGSHGTRYANFILEKADLILSIGNRLAFPPNSMSYSPMMNKKKIIRIDIDKNEFCRKIDNSLNICVDADIFVDIFLKNGEGFIKEEWIHICDTIKKQLWNYDCIEVVNKIKRVIEKQETECIYVCDVGNNEFWFSRAFEYCYLKGTVLYSKNFGTLGVALGRAIGAYYATHKKIVCVLGDQALQYNLAALQYISSNRLPIMVLVINNNASGMIMDHEKKMGFDRLIHVSQDNGYNVISIEEVATAHGLGYVEFNDYINECKMLPVVCEINSCDNEELVPTLQKANRACDMTPLLSRKIFDLIDNL